MINLRQSLDSTDSNPCELICNEIMDSKKCTFQFKCVEDRDVRTLLKSLPEYGNKVLIIAAYYISAHLSHIVNKCP